MGERYKKRWAAIYLIFLFIFYLIYFILFQVLRVDRTRLVIQNKNSPELLIRGLYKKSFAVTLNFCKIILLGIFKLFSLTINNINTEIFTYNLSNVKIFYIYIVYMHFGFSTLIIKFRCIWLSTWYQRFCQKKKHSFENK